MIRIRKRLNPSIRTQLLAWLVIPILVLLLVGAALTYGLAIRMATDAYDKALLDSVYSIAGCVKKQDGNLSVDIPPAALAILKDNMKDRVMYQVLDERHRIVAGDAKLPFPDFEDEDEQDHSVDYRDATVEGEPIRVASIKYQLPTNPGTYLYIQVAETLHGREQIADEILIGTLTTQFVIVTLSGLVVLLGVRRGLRPLNNLRDAVASRTPVDLGPIAVEDVPKEVRPLVTAINELLQRLQDDMQAQRRFVANAAHQLRTPIAGLKTQTELALRQNDPADVQHALSLIRTGAERAARLANQLLALARSEPGASNTDLFQLVDLNVVAREATKEFVPEAIRKNIDLGFEGTSHAIHVLGDQSSLHELAANLIDNAVLYTPTGGHVTVRVEPSRENGGAVKNPELIIEDDGPGIPAEERERIFERFYRLSDRSASGSGSGLGLAIVREIANVHRAEVIVGEGPDGHGASVRIVFPLPSTVETQPADEKRPEILTSR
ncbi:MAG TPA: sensor histidine kinase N-terminal domain-containing protein [Drouetiella sp.]|jgi:two-component system, OmpR family, sensor histidine kinase TctE